jgi:hypothetical protein
MQKKWTIVLIVAIILIAIILLMWHLTGGNTSSVNLTVSKSEIYSEQDITDAMDVVKLKFNKDFRGCKLTDLWYDEKRSVSSSGWAAQYNADEAIVLLSNFNVGPSGGDGSLNPNSIYKGWNWILVRNKGSKWELKTWGYG